MISDFDRFRLMHRSDADADDFLNDWFHISMHTVFDNAFNAIISKIQSSIIIMWIEMWKNCARYPLISISLQDSIKIICFLSSFAGNESRLNSKVQDISSEKNFFWCSKRYSQSDGWNNRRNTKATLTKLL